MANKRDLKNLVNYIASELISETLAIGSLEKNIANDDVDNLLMAIIKSHKDYIARINHPQPGMPQKQYFRLLTKSLNSDVDEFVDILSNLA